MNYLQRLEGKKASRASGEISEIIPLNEMLDNLSQEIKTETYIQIIIEEFTLNIYNPIQLNGISSYAELVGEMIINVKENENQVILFFQTCEIIIDMSEESYNGPEAMVMYGPNNLCVVWN